MKGLFAHPVLSAALLAIWLLLNATLAPGHVVLGIVLALALPAFLHRLTPQLLRVRRPLLAAAFLGRVLWDIVVANIRVAVLVLGPRSRLRPGFVSVPLDLRDPGVATILAGIITLTPGTVSIEIDAALTRIDVHVLDLEDEAALVAQIKARYEATLQRIFSC